MIIKTSECKAPLSYLCRSGARPQEAIYFDIETTGFKASRSHLYLIGAAVLKNGREEENTGRTSPADKGTGLPADKEAAVPEICGTGQEGAPAVWTVIQWFAERPQEEASLLRAFSDFVRPYRWLVHFNGDRFDIPYLQEKYDQYGLASPFGDMVSVDLYQDFRPLKKPLGMDHMNQKSLECFAGLNRRDLYDGGRLIQVYRDYCRSGQEDLLQLLLLHNREDVEGMMTIARLYAYDLLCSRSSALDRICQVRAQRLEDELILTFPLELEPPAPVDLELPAYQGLVRLSMEDRLCRIRVSLLRDRLCYFFPDPGNYYYLPDEDQAIHKSVAAFVDKDHRKQATARNCYIRREGCFLPCLDGHDMTPLFRRTWNDRLSWICDDHPVFSEPDGLCSYVRLLLG